MKTAVILFLTTFACGCGGGASPAIKQQSVSGAVIGTVTRIESGLPINGQPTMLVVTDKGTNDGVSVGTQAVIRFHKAGMLELRVKTVSDRVSTALGLSYKTIKPGDTIIFNLGGLSEVRLFAISDSLSK